MHIPSERIYNEIRSEDASLWYVTANGDDDLAFLIKAPTSCIKALIAGCPLQLFFAVHKRFLCIGAKITDIPDSPVFISGVQRYGEEHQALIRALTKRRFPIFLFNEMDINLAWTNIELSEQDAYDVLKLIENKDELYVGPFTVEASHALDCFCYSVEESDAYPNAHVIPIHTASVTFDKWRATNNHFYSTHKSHHITIDEKNEGETFERIIWASLESVFPLTFYKSPLVKIGEKTRELTDVFSFYSYGSFLIEAKDLSIINAGYSRNQTRRIAGVQKQVKKAITQLVGASKAFLRGEAIFDADGVELKINRSIPPHCIILITELMHYGDWEEIEIQLMKAMKETGAFFHLLDLQELIALLKESSSEAEQFDYHLMKRLEIFIEHKSIFIRSQPALPEKKVELLFDYINK